MARQIIPPTADQIVAQRKALMDQLTAVATELHSSDITDESHREYLERWQQDLIVAEQVFNWILGKRSTWY